MKVIYAIFDRKTGSCALVKEAACIEEFERWFATVFLRSDAMFALYPADFDIYELCGLDDEHMTINTDYPPSLILLDDRIFRLFQNLYQHILGQCIQ